MLRSLRWLCWLQHHGHDAGRPIHEPDDEEDEHPEPVDAACYYDQYGLANRLARITGSACSCKASVDMPEPSLTPERVRKRFERNARDKHPDTFASTVGNVLIALCVFVSGFALLGGAMTIAAVFEGHLFPVVLLLIGVGAIGVAVVGGLLSAPLDRRRLIDVTAQVDTRHETISKQREFYSSPEWQALRRRVIREEGERCYICSKLASGSDLAVDHIRPRSKFPHLALERSNLHVICRFCNSAKGAMDPDAYLDLAPGDSSATAPPVDRPLVGHLVAAKSAPKSAAKPAATYSSRSAKVVAMLNANRPGSAVLVIAKPAAKRPAAKPAAEVIAKPAAKRPAAKPVA